MTTFIWIIIGVYTINLLAILELIFVDKRDYSSLLIWTIVLLLLPFVGVIVYTIIGKGPSIGKRRRFLHKIDLDEEYSKEVESQKKLLEEESIFNEATVQLAYYNLTQQGSILTNNNSLEIITDMRIMYQKMFEDIENAKKSVNVLFFIIKNDEYGRAFRELLTKKAKQGVKIRLLYDPVGSFKLFYSFFKPLRKAGGEVYRFLPSIFKFLFRNVNYRNHRKIVVVDDKIAYTGGANIGKEYVNESKKIKPWHDSQIRVIGDAVTIINLRFMQDYNFASHKKETIDYLPQEKAGDKIIQVVSSGPDTKDEKIKLAYIKAIYSAKKKIYIQTPYFIPDESFIAALSTAAKSGVDIKIMIPGVPDKKHSYLCTTFYMKELLPYGVKFYLWKGFMHSKTLIVDDEIVSIGTFNIDIRSFKLHFEMTAFIYNKETNKELTNLFLEETKQSKLVPMDYKGSIFRNILERIMRLFTPLM